jgi:hypothetical protein
MARHISKGFDPEVMEVLDEVRLLIAKVAGVTLSRDRLTIRFGKGDKLKQIHCLILEVDDGEPEDLDLEDK